MQGFFFDTHICNLISKELSKTDMSDFDSMLWRPINSGLQFNSLFPPSTCTKKAIGSGNTDFSIKEMNALVSEFAYQTELVANVLKKNNLKDTCNSIKWFLYNHFQYKADNEDQMLRSPACSWHDRAIGIDCKSYSILASCILTNLGIKHYIRRIKQQGYAPEQFTHVYVVVPNNQITANLQEGSICIDGTLKQGKEPSFLIKNDLYMDLQHYALNGLRSEGKNLNGAFGDFIKDKISKFDFGSLQSYKNLFTCGDWNTAYNTQYLATNLGKLQTYFNQLIDSINQNAGNGNNVEFSKEIAEFLAAPILLEKAIRIKQDEGWNDCTTQNLDRTIDMVRAFGGNTALALKAYCNTYFTPGATSSIVFSNTKDNFGGYSIEWIQPTSVTQPLIQYTKKSGVELKTFELTPYVIEKMSSPTPIDIKKFISELSQIRNPNGNPNNNGNGNGNGNPNNNPDLPNTQTQAGFGVVGWLLVGGALIYGVKKFSEITKITK